MKDEWHEVHAKARRPDPQYRVWLCGPFRLERRVGEGYEPVGQRAWGGHTSPRTVLKALLCAPGRQMRRSALAAELWPEASEVQASREMSVALTFLRKVLRSNDGEEVLMEEGTKGLRLAGQDLLWNDADAASLLLDQAEQIGMYSPAALPLLEEALSYFERGPLLADDEGEWLVTRRAMGERRQYRCRLRLADLYGQQGCLERAETLLNDLLSDDPFDEDVICRLMLLLQQQGLTHQALVVYRQTRALFEEEGMELTEATRELAARLVRERPTGLMNYAEIGGSVPFFSPLSNASDPQDIIFPYQQVGSPHMNQARRKIIAQSFKLTGTSMLFSSANPSHWNTLDRFLRILQKPSCFDHSSIIYLDQKTLYYWRDRDEALLAPHELLRHVVSHFQVLTELLNEPLFPSIRTSLCSVASKTALLWGVLLYDLGDYQSARKVQNTALQAASEAGDQALQAVCCGWKCFTWINVADYAHALSSVQEAKHLALSSSDIRVQAWLSAIEAEICAHFSDRRACLDALKQVERTIDTSYSERTYALYKLDHIQFLGYKGTCLQQFYQKQDRATHDLLQEAQEALDLALSTDVPTRRKLTYLSDLASAYARQGEIEQACTYAVQCLPLLGQVNSQMAQKRLLQIQQLLHTYEEHSLVQAFDEQMASLRSQEKEGEKTWPPV